ncbi:MAG: hypothetical protein JOZ78_00200 [Chroococcidiopsidaceae cyanobacterium CP_BM_ER_R8_30]|nr:hypothetical protein [Chroococcidiopsidaceae cyanobacterium CP_BM_ER_R8_30]
MTKPTEPREMKRIPYPSEEPVRVPKNQEVEIEDDSETIALSNNPKFQAILERSRQSFKEKGGIPLEEIERELGLD